MDIRFSAPVKPYFSPSPTSPDSVSPVAGVQTPEDALKLARALVQFGEGGVARARTPAEARQRAAALLTGFLHGRLQVQQAQPCPESPPHRALRHPHLTPPPPQEWSPTAARALEDYLDTHVQYYKEVVAPRSASPPPALLKPGRSLEDELVNRLSIALTKSIYVDTQRGSTALLDELEDCLRAAEKAMQGAVLAAHNAVRRKLGCGALQLLDELSDRAASHAEKCAQRGAISYAKDLPSSQGQSLYFLHGKQLRDMSDSQVAQAALNHWVDHGSSVFAELGPTPSAVRAAPHYSQAVWRSTTHMGVAVSRSNGKAFVVCNYWPRGNKLAEAAVVDNIPHQHA